jgi:glycosyltransferase involved in cell wall biosynthesis
MPPRICYLDTSLQTDVGHFANACRHITGEFRRRQFAVDIYGNRKMISLLAKELGGMPFFRHAAFENIVAHLPISVLYRADYILGRISFLQDLKSIWRRGPYDLVYVNSILPAQLAALALWLRTFANGEGPDVVAEFGAPSGVGMADRAMQGSLRWRRLTPFYVEAAGLFGAGTRRPLLFTFDATASADYAEILQMPVETMPAVHAGLKVPRLRCGRDGGMIISFLGHQQEYKGYDLVPEIVRCLQARAVPVRILVHNGDPADDPISRELRAMANTCAELVFEHTPAGEAYWQDLLEQSDLIVLPYLPARYRASYSAIAIEAVSAGIPLVVPAGTTMETLTRTYKTGATTFAESNPTEIANAIEQAVNDFENLAQRSVSGAVRWNLANGAQAFVDRLLELRPIEHRNRMKRPENLGEQAFNPALDAFFLITTNVMAAARAMLLAYRRVSGALRRVAVRPQSRRQHTKAREQ